MKDYAKKKLGEKLQLYIPARSTTQLFRLPPELSGMYINYQWCHIYWFKHMCSFAEINANVVWIKRIKQRWIKNVKCTGLEKLCVHGKTKSVVVGGFKVTVKHQMAY